MKRNIPPSHWHRERRHSHILTTPDPGTLSPPPPSVTPLFPPKGLKVERRQSDRSHPNPHITPLLSLCVDRHRLQAESALNVFALFSVATLVRGRHRPFASLPIPPFPRHDLRGHGPRRLAVLGLLLPRQRRQLLQGPPLAPPRVPRARRGMPPGLAVLSITQPATHFPPHLRGSVDYERKAHPLWFQVHRFFSSERIY